MQVLILYKSASIKEALFGKLLKTTNDSMIIHFSKNISLTIFLLSYLDLSQNSKHSSQDPVCPTEMDYTSSLYVSGSHIRKTNIKATKSMRQFPAKLYALISITQRYIRTPMWGKEVTCSLIKEKNLDNK